MVVMVVMEAVHIRDRTRTRQVQAVATNTKQRESLTCILYAGRHTVFRLSSLFVYQVQF